MHHFSVNDTHKKVNISKQLESLGFLLNTNVFPREDLLDFCLLTFVEISLVA